MKAHFYLLFISIFYFQKVNAQTPNPCMNGDYEWAGCFEDELLDPTGTGVWVAVNIVNCVGSTGSTISVSDLVSSGYLVDPSISASTPQSLIIFGNLEIDIDYHFYQSKLFFENETHTPGGSGIGIAPGKKLIIDDTYISSCGFAWDGINVRVGSTLEIINNSLLSRSSRAVNVNNNTTIKIEDSSFRSNSVSINISNVQGATYQINRNKFEGILRFFPDFFNGTGDNFGITLVNSDPVTIGDENHFLSFREVGLGVENTELTLGNRNIFENSLFGLRIKNETDPNAFYDISRNSFINNYFGLSSFAVDSKIEHNYFEISKVNWTHPFNARAITGSTDDNTVDINNNVINRLEYIDEVLDGIVIEGERGTVDVYDNQINQYGRGSSIYVRDGNLISSFIHHNVITHESIFADNRGIHFRESTGINQAYENTIISNAEDASSFFTGILVDKADNVEIFDNNLTSKVNQLFESPPPIPFFFDQNNIKGIELLAAQNCRLECNEIEKFQYALRFTGNCSPTTVKNNIMNESGVGIMVHLISSFGSIINGANRFTGSFTYAEAVCHGDLTQNIFQVGYNVNDFYPNPHEPVGWVQLNGIVENFDCPPGSGPGSGSGLQLRKEATSDFNPTIYPNPVTNDFKILGIDQSATITIYSTKGRLVFEKIISGSDEEININTLSAGMYIVQITSADQVSNLNLIKH